MKPENNISGNPAQQPIKTAAVGYFISHALNISPIALELNANNIIMTQK
jgi:hypothetical protein